MKITVTMIHVVDAVTPDDAIERVLVDPLRHLAETRVKAPGRKLLHYAGTNVQDAAKKLQEMTCK